MNTSANPAKLSNHAANCEGTLATAVRKAIDNYLLALDGHEPIIKPSAAKWSRRFDDRSSGCRATLDIP